jgi:hypothetical protein
MSEALKYQASSLWRAYVLELCGRDWVGTFDSEEKAQTAIDRCACFRVRVNSLRVSYVACIEPLPDSTH